MKKKIALTLATLLVLLIALNAFVFAESSAPSPVDTVSSATKKTKSTKKDTTTKKDTVQEVVEKVKTAEELQKEKMENLKLQRTELVQRWDNKHAEKVSLEADMQQLNGVVERLEEYIKSTLSKDNNVDNSSILESAKNMLIKYNVRLSDKRSELEELNSEMTSLRQEITELITEGYTDEEKMIFDINADGMKFKYPLIKQLTENSIITPELDVQLTSPPIIVDGHVFMTEEDIATLLGAEVTWAEDSAYLLLKKDNSTLLINMADKVLQTNSRNVEESVQLQKLNEKTYISFGIVARHLGFDLFWNSIDETVEVQEALQSTTKLESQYSIDSDLNANSEETSTIENVESDVIVEKATSHYDVKSDDDDDDDDDEDDDDDDDDD